MHWHRYLAMVVAKPLSVIAFRDATSPAKAGEERNILIGY
jgi:hypothetical protein